MLSTLSGRWLTLTAAVALACATLVSAAPPTARAADPPGTLVSKVLINGAPIHGANGLAVDQQGRLLVASAFGSEIRALDPTTGKILAHIGPKVGGVDVGGPDDVAVAPDGSICWTDFPTGYVDCLRTDGHVDRQFVGIGVNPIAFLPPTDAFPEGRMFVALAFVGDKLYELDPALIAPPRLIMSGSGVPPFPDQLNGFDFGSDGKLYAPRPFSGQIGWIDVDAPSPTFEVIAGGFPASSVEFDPAGPADQLYASLPVTGEVVKVDIKTGALTLVAQLAPNLDNMTFDPSGRLYVSNSNDGSVVRVLPSGEHRTLSGAGLILPGGIAAVGGGTGGGDRLYIADLWSLAEYDGRTGRVRSIDMNSHLGGTVTTPWTVSPDGADVIVTSWMANLVQIWDPVANVQVAAWPDFAVPVDAIRFGDDLVVAELGTRSVVRQTPGGVRSTIADGIDYPLGLAASGDDLWVTDWQNGTVWRIVTDGAPTMVQVATGLDHPEGLAVDHDGSLLVVESGAGRLTRILPSGDTVMVAEGLRLGVPPQPGAPPAGAFNGVAVGPSGAIYVTNDATSTVWRFTEAPR
jgi:sugar lactone lactonase YvrE